jgi:hypothetical protein
VNNPRPGGEVNAASHPAQPEITPAPVATTASVTNPPAAAQSAKGKN